MVRGKLPHKMGEKSRLNFPYLLLYSDSSNKE